MAKSDLSLPAVSPVVFISWSGARAKAVAQALRHWLGLVIQAAEPWMSEADIDAGSLWGDEIGKKLAVAKVGIICVTPENQDKPWLNFEAGALAKSIDDKTRVCPYLFGMEKTDLIGPLTRLQVQKADEDGTWRIVDAISRVVNANVPNLKKTFEKWWDDLARELHQVPRLETRAKPKRTVEDMIGEVLTIVRELQARPEPVDWRHIAFGPATQPQFIGNTGITYTLQPAQAVFGTNQLTVEEKPQRIGKRT